jgi:branched-chain amino acid transport system permease protein
MTISRRWIPAIVIAIAIAFPYIVPNPTFWVVNGGTRTLWIGLLALSMAFLNRNLGLMSLGQLFFSGMTSYTIAIMSAKHGVSFGVSIPLGIIIGTLAGLIIGWVALKTEGVYFLMLTLAVALGLYSLSLAAETITGGHTGINSVAPPKIFGVDIAAQNTFYYICLAINVAVFATCVWLQRTNFGLALNGIRDNSARTTSLGYSNSSLRLAAFTFSSFIASIGGVIGLFYYQAISPDSVGLVRSIDLLIVVVVGGASYLAGSYVGAAVIAVFESIIQDYTTYYVAAEGVLFIVILLLAPQGLMGIGDQLRAYRANKALKESSGA